MASDLIRVALADDHTVVRALEARRAGAGLGLPIAKGIVDAHGGRMWVESEVGRGSTFSFSLRAAASA
jgi:signal transduction histidine kinase